MDVTAIVLAGGRSSRLGRDKLAEPFRGVPLVHRAIAAVAPVASDVVVVAAPGWSIPGSSEPAQLGVRLVHDIEPFGGPLAGLVRGLADVSHPITVVIAGDMPLIEPTVLWLLAERLRAAPNMDAAVLQPSRGAEPPVLPLAVRTVAARVTAEQCLRDGRRSLRAVIGSLGVTVVASSEWRVHDPGGRSLVDIDGPDDLARWSTASDSVQTGDP